MKYSIDCPKCGQKYEVEMDFIPSFCMKCGFDMPSVVLRKTKARVRAEEAMCRMDYLKPCLTEAREKYMDLMMLYEAENQIIRQYARRGVVTEEEKQKYAITGDYDIAKTSVQTLLKEYRAEKGLKTENQKRWEKYASKTYVPVDHSRDLAMQMFGKRRRDLTPEEMREYNRECARRSRENARRLAEASGGNEIATEHKTEEE